MELVQTLKCKINLKGTYAYHQGNRNIFENYGNVTY